MLPGSGAASSGPLISYLIGRGERFIVFLDDDKAGRRAAERYKENFILSSDEILTLGDLMPEFTGKCLECLLSSETRNTIKTLMCLQKSPTKKEIGLYLAEACDSKKPHVFSSDTKAALLGILDEISSRFSK